MPEADIEVGATSVLVQWGPVRLAGPGTVRLTSDSLLVEATSGGSLTAMFAELRGGSWRAGTLTVHGAQGSAAIQAKHGLEHAWGQLLERACPLPELARAHRTLGSRRGGSAEAQARFLAPLLQARKRLNEVADLDARVQAIEAKVLRERITTALRAIASETFPSSHPERRGLEAELEEALAAFFAGLQAMESAAIRFRNAPEPVRFMAWRDWVSTVADAFALADSGWASASRLLPGSPRP